MLQTEAALILVAGGKSTRMGGGIKKEMRHIEGEPVLVKALKPFLNVSLFQSVIIVLTPSTLQQAEMILSSCFSPAIRSKTTCIPGGETRQESVYNGLRALPSTTTLVLIHDGARPWINENTIHAVYEKALTTGAAVPVIPSVNAIKEIDSAGRIIRSLDRSKIVGAQTPQGFRYPDILSAHRKAALDGKNYPDDAELFAACAGDVYTVAGDLQNRKITYKEDMEK